ncbi:MAG TPA: DUF5677 domain-containing protein [Thermoanaerobaculia bacterium]|jgi:hypothetical protein|nr:DUF5677 domain-containing protein [Thermoanaerobaculia bacterium]
MDYLHRALFKAIEQLVANSSLEQLEAVLEDDERLGRAVTGTLGDLAKDISRDLYETRTSMLADRARVLADIQEEIDSRWSPVLDGLETLVVVALEAGADFSQEYRAPAFEAGKYSIIALTSLHARACQIAQEVVALLRAGFADGAHARWRSLYELAVIAFLLAGKDENLSERYLWHQHVEAWRAMKEQNEYATRLGTQGYSQDELEASSRRCDELLQRYGDAFKHSYGWAAELLKKKSPTFADLEKHARLDHFRPYYRMASHNVHAGPRGIAFRLGMPPSKNVLLAGPSIYGFVDPAHGAAISLYQCSVALLAHTPNVDRLVILKIMGEMVNEVGSSATTVSQSMKGTVHNINSQQGDSAPNTVGEADG